jgi:hypothetical protein
MNRPMRQPLRYVHPLARYAVYQDTGPTTAELNADLEREWARHQAEAKARAQAERDAEDTQLEIAAIDHYLLLGKAVGGITTEQSWVDLAEEVERLVGEKQLSSRHGQELQDRLLRVARHRGWTTG